ncbi:phospholipid-translocating P-type ATPase [Macrolepiota fuliginosa MF-IS2]|uniref:Phospholipid-transporting ATPase n=1 Tax=Macrolepiota fuliginosa MF-IS2 TaxID=1400762 RepID=A0A9P5XEL3_9AGAR|nr:phospholipid-translocating P-type ATPase [Macrolepiota fuliginosa MF-IS2]
MPPPSAKRGSRLSQWYGRIAAFNVEELFSRKREPGPPRTVFVHQDLPQEYYDHKGRVKKETRHTSNQVITSKYTIITFVPRNLLEQFRRIANIFFLSVAILQFFPKFSTISGAVAILPLIIIIAITAAKDGYEDFKRHQSDKKVNYSKVYALSGGEWSNRNPTKAKTKTFVRGIIPSRAPSARKMGSSDPTWAFDYEDADVQGQGAHDRPQWKKILWEDLRVGDFVKIREDEHIPADLLICATSEEEDVAFVETKNLDGETNLKSRHAVPCLTHLNNAQDCADTLNKFHVKCDRPDTDMYRLNANVTLNGYTSSVDLSMTLLRGTVLRNTKWVVGIVLFTGLDTKIVMNSGGTPSKRSKVERQMNPQVLFNLVLMAGMAVVCAIVDSLLEVHYYPRQAPWLYGDNTSGDNPRINGLVTWAYSLLTFQDIVPISLYISIEFVKTCQAAWIYFDADIWYEKTNQATIARSWNLSDDLGQIEYIFSDKTGTLTQNLMVFRQCSIGGVAYTGGDNKDEEIPLEKPSSLHSKDDIPGIGIGVWAANHSSGGLSSRAPDPLKDDDTIHFYDRGLEQDLEAALSEESDPETRRHARSLNGFFTVLSLCHTVLTAEDPETGHITYKAQSPDEAALVQAAADVGYQFLGRDRDILSLRTPHSEGVEKYELLNILEFTSARKRMSVVLRRAEGDDHRLFLLTKGADNVIFERLKRGMDDDIREETERHLSQFANEGLRTLTLAYKVISDNDYEAWSKRYHEATIAMDNREEQIEAVSSELEQDLRLLGATAIEDKLQDGVPETIADLKRAGIKIWVATGDKLETAIAIGRSTNLINPDSNIIIVRGGPRPAQQQIKAALVQFFPEANASASAVSLPRSSTTSRDKDKDRGIPLQRMVTAPSIVGTDNGDRPGGFVLVVDGAALLEVFADEEDKALLLRLATLCEGVICCRVSPLQKALVVHLVKDNLGVMTLAIGDGANDVSMIQAADVGVGISGEEGLQAVNSSDYAIAQFRFLKKLLLVHGHWSYARNGLMIVNFFYKNIVPTGALWWFQIYCGWSGAFAFNYIYILLWNSVWTIAPVIGIGLFDRFLDARVLMAVPELYHYGRKGSWFGMRLFFLYMFDGLVQSTIIFFFIWYTYVSVTSRPDGFAIAQSEISTTMAITTVMVANMYTGFNATAWTGWLFFAVWLGIVIVWVFTVIYSIIAPSYAVTPLFGSTLFSFHSAYFWLCIPFAFVLAMAPRYLFKGWQFIFRPNDIDIVRWISQNDPHADLSHLTMHSDGAKSTLKDMLEAQRRTSMSSVASRTTSRRSSIVTLDRFAGPSMDIRSASRTDMATGMTSVERGFDFATEERGVAIQRIQTNLSERRENKVARKRSILKGKETLSHVLSLKRMRKKPPSPKKGGSGSD